MVVPGPAVSRQRPRAPPRRAKAASVPSKKAPSPPPLKPAKPTPAVQYTSAAAAPKPLAENDAIIGITVWRMRPADEADPATLTAGRESGGLLKVTPERVETDTLLREGDRVRLTIEAPRKGYLYVIDRERYADGTSSAPYLIFRRCGSRAERTRSRRAIWSRFRINRIGRPTLPCGAVSRTRRPS